MMLNNTKTLINFCLGLKPILVKSLVFQIEDVIQKEEYHCFVENIETLYNFEFNGEALFSKQFSFYENQIPVKIIEMNTIVHSELKKKPEIKVPEFVAKFNHLKRKRIKMCRFLEKYRLDGDLNLGGVGSNQNDDEDDDYDENDEEEDMEESDDDEDIEDLEDHSLDFKNISKIIQKPIFCNEGKNTFDQIRKNSSFFRKRAIFYLIFNHKKC